MNHEVFNHAMEFAAFVALAFWFFCELLKVTSGLWDGSTEESNFDATGRLASDFNVEENLNGQKINLEMTKEVKTCQ